jgi:hypothetical protein
MAILTHKVLGDFLANVEQFCRVRFDQRLTGDPRELTYELTRIRRVAGSSRLACTQQTRCGMHSSIFSHTPTITFPHIYLAFFIPVQKIQKQIIVDCYQNNIKLLK